VSQLPTIADKRERRLSLEKLRRQRPRRLQNVQFADRFTPPGRIEYAACDVRLVVGPTAPFRALPCLSGEELWTHVPFVRSRTACDRPERHLRHRVAAVERCTNILSDLRVRAERQQSHAHRSGKRRVSFE
jgi:hypothetical protein